MIEFFNKLPDTAHVEEMNGGLRFLWTRKGIGHGEIVMFFRDGKFVVDTECMSPEFCADIVKQVVEQALKEQDEKR